MPLLHTQTKISQAAPSLRAAHDIRIGLLGLGVVGSAVADLVRTQSEALGRRTTIAAALVRNTSRLSNADLHLTADPQAIFDSRPNVIVEVLGGLEPARTLVLDALARGIPVVTANKSLLAHHGDELLDAAAAAGVPLCYEASVIAGVPFLSTFARRPLASSITSFTGVVNGTSNYILSRIEDDGTSYDVALADAQACGFAEPEPAKDILGIDALEKLVVLLRQLAGTSVIPDDIETGGITNLIPADLSHARALGGTVKPVVDAEWAGTNIKAFAGPAFVPSNHPVAALRGATNGISLRDRAGSQLFLSGPGAGPAPTAVTILDDVLEAVSGGTTERRRRVPGTIDAPDTGWFIRLTSQSSLPRGEEIADLFGTYGVWIARTSSRDTRAGGERLWLLTYPCTRERAQAAVRTLASITGCDASHIRALGTRS